jgi:plastocyanin
VSGPRAALLALASASALLVAAPAASAETHDVDARDGAASCPPGLQFGCWVPDIVEATAGDTVVWDFSLALQPHDLWLKPEGGPEEQLAGIIPGGSSETRQRDFPDQGAYEFYCKLHSAVTGGVRTGMVGGVYVDTDPPDPGPDPLPNPTEPPPSWEDPDDTAPKLTKVKAQGAKGAAQISFKLSEAARVSGKLRRNGRKAGKAGPWDAPAGSSEYEVEGLRRGRYTVALRARDDAGNRSKVRTASFRVR